MENETDEDWVPCDIGEYIDYASHSIWAIAFVLAVGLIFWTVLILYMLGML